MFVDVPSTRRRCHRVLRELAFEPTYNLCHRSRLVLFSRCVLQLMFLSSSVATLLRLDELRVCVVALRVIMIVSDSLMVSGSLLIIIGYEINDVAMDIAAGNVLRYLVVYRRHDHVTIQYMWIGRRVGRVGRMRRVVPRRVVSWCRVSRFSDIRSRFGCGNLGKRCIMMGAALPN